MPDGNATKNQLCFVIGPIGKDNSVERKHADLLLHSVIKHVLEDSEFKYTVKRADEDADPGMIGDRVVSDIINADLVVTDLTDLNPNVFYELGIRHSIEKPTIHIARLGTALPFDNVTHRTIFVDLADWYSIQSARNRLAESARTIRSPEYRVSNPITQANASFRMRQSEDPKERLIADVQERMAALESSLTKIRFSDAARTARQKVLEAARGQILSDRDLKSASLMLREDEPALSNTIVSFTSPAGLADEDINRIYAALFKQFGYVTKLSMGSTGFTVVIPGTIDVQSISIPPGIADVHVRRAD